MTREAIKFAKKHFDGKTRAIVEVGVGCGTHALDMFSVLNPDIMYLVDPFFPPDNWPKAEIERARNECKLSRRIVETVFKNYTSIKTIFKESNVGCNDVESNLDLVYIDAIHDYFNVIRDIECWFPKIRKGGILCGHDFYHEGVRKAVLDKFNFKLEIPYAQRVNWGTEGSDWWIVK